MFFKGRAGHGNCQRKLRKSRVSRKAGGGGDLTKQLVSGNKAQAEFPSRKPSVRQLLRSNPVLFPRLGSGGFNQEPRPPGLARGGTSAAWGRVGLQLAAETATILTVPRILRCFPRPSSPPPLLTGPASPLSPFPTPACLLLAC